MPVSPVIFLVGPTAVGKTEIACELALLLKGEIISCDSMQVYREFSVVSNKPPAELLRRVGHHLIDVISVREEFDVAAFQKRALSALADIRGRGRTPIFVGGSGLYMSVLLDGIFEGGGRDQKLRAAMELEAEEQGLAFLYGRLEQVDPLAAGRIHPHDRRRIIRALEVYQLKDRPISDVQKEREGLWGKDDVRIVALNRPRAELYALINERVERMFQEGFVEEIKRLEGIPLSQTAEKIIGVREVRLFLEGALSLSEAKALVQQNTRRYAKRQLVWFRRDERLSWIEVGMRDTAAEVARRIETELKK